MSDDIEVGGRVRPNAEGEGLHRRNPVTEGTVLKVSRALITVKWDTLKTPGKWNRRFLEKVA